jgi:hypothetical protein
MQAWAIYLCHGNIIAGWSRIGKWPSLTYIHCTISEGTSTDWVAEWPGPCGQIAIPAETSGESL